MQRLAAGVGRFFAVLGEDDVEYEWIPLDQGDGSGTLVEQIPNQPYAM